MLVQRSESFCKDLRPFYSNLGYLNFTKLRRVSSYLSVIFLPQPAHSCGEVFFCVSVFTSIVIMTPETKESSVQTHGSLSRSQLFSHLINSPLLSDTSSSISSICDIAMWRLTNLHSIWEVLD